MLHSAMLINAPSMTHMRTPCVKLIGMSNSTPFTVIYSGYINGSLYKMLRDGCKLSPNKEKSVLSTLQSLTSAYNYQLVTTKIVLHHQLLPHFLLLLA